MAAESGEGPQEMMEGESSLGPARPRPLRGGSGRPEGGCQLPAVGLVVPPLPGSPRVSTPRTIARGEPGPGWPPSRGRPGVGGGGVCVTWGMAWCLPLPRGFHLREVEDVCLLT